MTLIYNDIYNKKDKSYFRLLEKKVHKFAIKNNCNFIDNELHYGHAEQEHPIIVNYFYYKQVRGSKNMYNTQTEAITIYLYFNHHLF